MRNGPTPSNELLPSVWLPLGGFGLGQLASKPTDALVTPFGLAGGTLGALGGAALGRGRPKDDSELPPTDLKSLLASVLTGKSQGNNSGFELPRDADVSIRIHRNDPAKWRGHLAKLHQRRGDAPSESPAFKAGNDLLRTIGPSEGDLAGPMVRSMAGDGRADAKAQVEGSSFGSEAWSDVQRDFGGYKRKPRSLQLPQFDPPPSSGY